MTNDDRRLPFRRRTKPHLPVNTISETIGKSEIRPEDGILIHLFKIQNRRAVVKNDIILNEIP